MKLIHKKKKREKQKAPDDKNDSPICSPKKGKFHFSRRMPKITTNVELTA